MLAIAKSIPAPVSGMICGVFGELSASVIMALRAPIAAGANVTVRTQVALGATVPLQLSVSRKSPGFVPASEMAPISSTPDPEFETVTATGALMLPMSWLGKFRLVGERETAG